MSSKAHVTVLGVPVHLRPIMLLWIPIYTPIGYLIARWRGYSQRDALIIGLITPLIWYETGLLHVIGHIISARAASAPMDYVQWNVMPVNGYNNHDVTPKQHIGRSLGGPIVTALVALLYWALFRTLKGDLPKAIAAIGGIHNSVIALGSLMPMPFVDGGVIYANLKKRDR